MSRPALRQHAGGLPVRAGQPADDAEVAEVDVTDEDAGAAGPPSRRPEHQARRRVPQGVQGRRQRGTLRR